MINEAERNGLPVVLPTPFLVVSVFSFGFHYVYYNILLLILQLLSGGYSGRMTRYAP